MISVLCLDENIVAKSWSRALYWDYHRAFLHWPIFQTSIFLITQLFAFVLPITFQQSDKYFTRQTKNNKKHFKGGVNFIYYMMRLTSDQLDWCETGHICEKVVIDKEIDIDTTRHGWTKLERCTLVGPHPPPSTITITSAETDSSFLV